MITSIKEVLAKKGFVTPFGRGCYSKPLGWIKDHLDLFGNIRLDIPKKGLPLHLYLCGDGGLAIFPSKGKIKNHHGKKKFKVGNHTLIIYRNIYEKVHPG